MVGFSIVMSVFPRFFSKSKTFSQQAAAWNIPKQHLTPTVYASEFLNRLGVKRGCLGNAPNAGGMLVSWRQQLDDVGMTKVGIPY